jgi:hypothetical protein
MANEPKTLGHEPPVLHWEPNGPNILLMLDNKYVGHFYVDASDGVDADEILNEMVSLYNQKRGIS